MPSKPLGKGYRLDKDGKLQKIPVYRDVSAKIAARKSKAVRVVKAPPR
jgi:hypothetical protein